MPETPYCGKSVGNSSAQMAETIVNTGSLPLRRHFAVAQEKYFYHNFYISLYLLIARKTLSFRAFLIFSIFLYLFINSYILRGDWLKIGIFSTSICHDFRYSILTYFASRIVLFSFSIPRINPNFSSSAFASSSLIWVYVFNVTPIYEWPIRYCNVFGFIPDFAMLLQNVCLHT